MKKLTTEDLKRIYNGITETTKLIIKEKSYSFDLQKKDYLLKLENHLSNLFRMIEMQEI